MTSAVSSINVNVLTPNAEIETSSVGSLGFGEFAEGVDKDPVITKVYALAMWILFAVSSLVAITVMVWVCTTFISVAMIAAVTAVASFAFVTFIAFAIKSCMHWLSFNKGPCTSTLGLNPEQFGAPELGKEAPLDFGIVSPDSKTSIEWKMKLLEEAKHCVILSGCWCGEEVFDEFLLKVKEKLTTNSSFYIYIISSSMDNTASNIEKVKELHELFPERFLFLTTSIKLHVNPGAGLTSNHVKAMCIDYGRAFIIGGSGLTNRYKMSFEVESETPLYDANCFVSNYVAKGFRDTDFLFQSSEQQGIGLTLHLELLKLYSRWYYYMQGNWPDHLYAPPIAHAFEEAFQNPIDFGITESKNMTCKLYATGPEHLKNPFLEEMIDRIEHADESITIAQLYFHPENELYNSLLRAALRGVKIHVISNGNEAGITPCSHKFFVDRSRNNVFKLAREAGAGQITYDEYISPNVTYHKKVMQVDRRWVFLGSSNMGFKSQRLYDYELNCVIDSKSLARETLDGLNNDLSFCRNVLSPTDEVPSIPCGVSFMSCIQRLFAPFIG